MNEFWGDIPFEIVPMRLADLPAVMEIERQSFSTPWTADAYRYELRHNPHAYYYVARLRETASTTPPTDANGWRGRLRRLLKSAQPAERPIVGYVGYWLVAGEAHISTIAVHPAARRRGIGELLIVHVIENAMAQGAHFVTLEVRVSNVAAQRLYEKYGFERQGRRRGYYSDTREDAWIMSIPDLRDPQFLEKFQRNKEALRRKLTQVQPQE